VRCDELPTYFAPYAHVLGGYRCELSVAQCVRSLFEWHNETLNIWTELLPAALFAGAIARLLRAESVAQMDAPDRGLLLGGLVVALVVRPLCSAAAHLLYCATERRLYALWWSVDYVSICLAILAVSLVCARNAFFCEPELGHLFFVCSSGLLCTSLIAVLCTASSSVRAFSFLLFVLFCNVVPLCYTLLSKLDGWYHNDAPWAYIYSWVVSLLVFLLGMVIKSASVPEACAPGAFDLVGSSHQLWHVCINVAFVFGTLVPWRIYADWRATAPCPAQPTYFGFGLGAEAARAAMSDALGGGAGWAT
jgi:adiponectin receptor